MPVSRAKQLEVMERREKVADLYIQGHTQAAIGKQLGVVQSIICDDLAVIRKQWLNSTVRNFDLARAEQLLKLDRVESEAWEAWERSKKPGSTATISEGENNKKQSRRTIKQKDGDPRFLQIVGACIVQRRAILGLDLIPQAKEGEGDGPLTLDVRQARVLAIFDSLTVKPRNGRVIAEPPTLDAGPVCGGGERGTLEDGTTLEAPRPGDHGEH